MISKRHACLVAALLAAGSAGADEIGQELYQDYCAACHGAEAHGGGEIADLLTVEVPDLTRIAERNDGAFPMLDVIRIIDGREGVRGHGGPMPVYGAMFKGSTGERGEQAAEIMARGRVLSIATYLEGIQREAE